MELRHLRYFVAAAEEEHFGRASNRLHVTRPAVSQLVSDLEQEVGTPLFERLAHRVRLTAAGHSLLPQVRAVMKNLDEAIVLAKRVGEGKSGTLNIGYGTLTLLQPLFANVVKRYNETYPDVALSLFEWSTTDQSRALAEGRIHGGFMLFGDGAFPDKAPGSVVGSQYENVLDWCLIQNGGIGVAVPLGHRLAHRSSVKIGELATERFVIVPRSRSSPGAGPLYALCQAAGFVPNVVQHVGTIGTQINLISLGMAVGLAVTGSSIAYPATVAVIPLDDVSYDTSLVFAWIKGERTPALDRMIEIVKELAADG